LAIQHRLTAIRSETEIAHAMLFLNCRAEAGASLGHVHWQLIGTPLVSSQLQRRADREREHQSDFGISLIGNLIDWESKLEFAGLCGGHPRRIGLALQRYGQAFRDFA